MSLLLSLSLLFTTGCACDDADQDGACDEVDVCEGDDFADMDEDGVCDAMDLCDGDDASGDNDADGECDDVDEDDDNDTVLDDLDVDSLDATQCEDLDDDGCDDCSNGLPAPQDDGLDTDADGACDAGDPDDDNDGVLDPDDSAPLDPFVCSDTDADTCEDCSSGVYDPSDDGEDWNSDGQCDEVDPPRAGFHETQTVLGKTVSCDSVTNTDSYSECTNTLVDGLYFPNHTQCGPLWSTEESPATDHESFCLQITGSTQFEVYYTCASSIERVTLYGETWGTVNDNGYTESVRCFYPSKDKDI